MYKNNVHFLTSIFTEQIRMSDWNQQKNQIKEKANT